MESYVIGNKWKKGFVCWDELKVRQKGFLEVFGDVGYFLDIQVEDSYSFLCRESKVW